MNLFQAAEYAQSLSVCKKRKVGAAIELSNRVVSIGFNHGTNEACHCSLDNENPNVLHAEAMAFIADDDFCFRGAILAVTYLPCIDCAKLIVKNGIKKVYYRDDREDKKQGVNFLLQNGVKVENKWNY